MLKSLYQTNIGENWEWRCSRNEAQCEVGVKHTTRIPRKVLFKVLGKILRRGGGLHIRFPSIEASILVIVTRPPHAHSSCLQLKKAPYPQWSNGVVFKGHIKYSCKIKKHHIHTQSLVIKRVRLSKIINNTLLLNMEWNLDYHKLSHNLSFTV